MSLIEEKFIGNPWIVYDNIFEIKKSYSIYLMATHSTGYACIFQYVFFFK